MFKAVVLQHADREGPGRIEALLGERRIACEILPVYAGADVPAGLSDDERVLVVMGGSMGVGDIDDPRFPFLRPELALLEQQLSRGGVVLGVCLGAQLVARAADAPVYKNMRVGRDGASVPAPEVGWGPVCFEGLEHEPVLAGLAPCETVLHWHGDTFDLPKGAVRLAATDICRNQAFRIGHRVFGLQFHVEADAEMAKRWAVEDAGFAIAAGGPEAPARIRADSDAAAARARGSGDRLLRQIFDSMGL